MTGDIACRLLGYLMLFVYLGVCFRVSTARRTDERYNQAQQQSDPTHVEKVRNPKSFAEELYWMNDRGLCDSPFVKHYFNIDSSSVAPSEDLYLKKLWIQCLMHEFSKASLGEVRARKLHGKTSGNDTTGGSRPMGLTIHHCHNPLIKTYSKTNLTMLSSLETEFLKKYHRRCKILEPHLSAGLMKKIDILPQDNEKKLKRFRKLYESQCKPVKTHITLESKVPNVQYIPKCVQIKRCGGCCPDDRLECSPVGKIKKERILVQEVKSFPNGNVKMIWKEMTLEKHTKCTCQCKIRKENCTRHQKFDSDTCSCSCNNVEKCSHPSQWDPVNCQCSCPRKIPCSSGYNFDHKSCKCAKSKDLYPL